jgi:hypothetical protein
LVVAALFVMAVAASVSPCAVLTALL